MNYRLEPDRLIRVADQLALRVAERLPESGLSKVVADLAVVARDACIVAGKLAKPDIPLRLLVASLTLAVIAVAIIASASLRVRVEETNALEIAQGLESLINILVFGGAGIYFVWTVESYRKRQRALALIAQLRSLAHVIDMHQISKDPDRLNDPLPPTESSPPRLQMTPDLLVRYLDYCSAALSILSKLAAMQVQHFDDPVTLDAVNDMENLSSGLARKIWQKIMIIDRPSPRAAR